MVVKPSFFTHLGPLPCLGGDINKVAIRSSRNLIVFTQPVKEIQMYSRTKIFFFRVVVQNTVRCNKHADKKGVER